MRQVWYKKGQRHRDGNKPAMIDEVRQHRIWYTNGILQRETIFE
jgi:hypothetical protein